MSDNYIDNYMSRKYSVMTIQTTFMLTILRGHI